MELLKPQNPEWTESDLEAIRLSAYFKSLDRIREQEDKARLEAEKRLRLAGRFWPHDYEIKLETQLVLDEEELKARGKDRMEAFLRLVRRDIGHPSSEDVYLEAEQVYLKRTLIADWLEAEDEYAKLLHRAA